MYNVITLILNCYRILTKYNFLRDEMVNIFWGKKASKVKTFVCGTSMCFRDKVHLVPFHLETVSQI